MPRTAISVDLGSTWTKGILVDLDGGITAARRDTPTTPQDLALGFRRVFEALEEERGRLCGRGGTGAEVFLTSSAKGGLAVAAAGIVPELTVKAARLAASSAGARIAATYAYKLTASDLEDLASRRCDVLLLAGGTDGGDESYVLHNARALAASGCDAAVVYAGNAAVRDEVLRILREAGKRAVGAANILPDLDRIEAEDARRAISELFLERIVEGKGLSEVRRLCSAEPRPTPAAVFDLVSLLGEGEDGLLLVDMGGATTDVYSACEDGSREADRIYRGIREGRLRRTVEGDLGLRISAPHAAELGRPRAVAALGASGCDALAAWAARGAADPGILPSSEEERRLDDILAETCLAEALRRHAGTLRPSYTASGPVWIQNGVDLGAVGVLIGSGGRLAREGSYPLLRAALAGGARGHTATAEQGVRLLLPEPARLRYYRDADYRIPPTAGLAKAHPAVAAALARAGLVEETDKERSDDRP